MRKIKEDDCGIARIESGIIKMWTQGDNQKVWRMKLLGGTVGKIIVETNRERKPDPSGMKNWRVVTNHEFTIHLYCGRQEFKLDEKLYFHGSLKDALKDVANGYQTGHLHRLVEYELERKALSLGVNKVTIWNVLGRAGNQDERLIALQREIEQCKKK